MINRINIIKRLRNKITFIQANGIEIVRNNIDNNNIFFLDSPYTACGKKAGSRLYNHHVLDHKLLFSLCNDIGHFLMTYDISEEIYTFSKEYNFKIRSISMKNTHNTKMKEYIISKNLEWV